jgi:hypothetical protein
MRPIKYDRDLAKHNKQIASIRELILTGMRLVNKTAATQARNEKNLESLIHTLRHRAYYRNSV